MLDREIFPNVEYVEWFSHPIAEELLGYERDTRLNFNKWKKPDELPTPRTTEKYDISIIGFYEPEIVRKQVIRFPQFAGARIVEPSAKLNPCSETHLTRQLHSALEDYLNVDYCPPQPEIILASEETASTRKNIEQLFNGKKFVLISVSAGGREKTFKEDGWKKVIKRMAEKYPVYVSYCKTNDAYEENMIVNIRSVLKNIDVAYQMPSLRELAALSREAKFFLAPDSGPMHTMAAAGARGFCISTAMPPATWKPLSDRVHVIDRYPKKIEDVSIDGIFDEIEGNFFV